MFKRTDKKQRLNKLLALTEKKFNRGSSKKWKNKDFEDLCFSIHLETKILISSGTLKRVFGKIETNKDYFPQEATITALEMYTGYELFPTIPVKKSKFNSKLISYAAGVLVLLIVIAAIFLFPMSHEIPTGDLSLLKIDGTSPATVYFNYQHSPSKDSVFINWGDNSDPQYLRRTEGQVSHYYRYPGKLVSNLETRKNVISNKVQFFIPTQGWQVLASYFDQEYEERYFPVPLEENCSDGAFQITRKYLSSLGMDTTRIVVIQLDNFKETNITGDSFSLETNIRNSLFWPAIRCFSAYISVEGEKGEVHFKFVKSGCSQFSEYIIGEKNKHNFPEDLTGFCVDMSKWNKVNIDNKNKNVTVKVNDDLVFNESYNESIGKIKGATVMFHGIGSVDYFYLKDSTDNYVFKKDFK